MRGAPWDEIRREYVESPLKPSIAYLAEKYRLNPTTVVRRSSKEGWVKQKREHWEGTGGTADQFQPGGTSPPSPAEAAKRQRIAHLTEAIEVLEVKLKPVNVVRDEDGKMVSCDYDVPKPFTNVGMLMRQLVDMTKLRDDLESSLPAPPGDGDPGGDRSASYETEVGKITEVARRIVGNEHLLKAGRDAVDMMDAGDAGSGEPERPGEPGDGLDAILEALAEEAGGTGETPGDEEPDG